MQVLGIADAGSGDTLEAARTLLHLPLHSQAFANLEDGTKRALGLMLQSLDAVSTTVSRMRSAADGIRAALDHVRAVPNPSAAGGSRADSGGGAAGAKKKFEFSYDYGESPTTACERLLLLGRVPHDTDGAAASHGSHEPAADVRRDILQRQHLHRTRWRRALRRRPNGRQRCRPGRVARDGPAAASRVPRSCG